MIDNYHYSLKKITLSSTISEYSPLLHSDDDIIHFFVNSMVYLK